MVRKKYILFFALAVVGLAFFTVADAWAACLQSGPNGCERFQTAGGWVMEILPGTVCDGTDTRPECVTKSGKPITGYMFSYRVTAPGSGYTLVQANVLVEDCGEGNRIAVTYPPSVKMLTDDPNSRYGAGSPDYVITWDSQKLDESNHSNFAVYTTKAGWGKRGALLKTGNGYEEVDEIVGPVCCKQTQVATQITVGGSIADFDGCSGDFTGTVTGADGFTPLTLVEGPLYACWTDIDATDIDKNFCKTIKKIGPGFGAFLDVIWPGTCALTCSGTRYYGYGTTFYKEDMTGLPLPMQGDAPACDGSGPALQESRIVFDGKVAFHYNADSYICGISSVDDTVYGAPVKLWIFESTSNGKMSDIGGPVVDSGPRNGVIIYSNPIYGTYSGWGWRYP